MYEEDNNPEYNAEDFLDDNIPTPQNNIPDMGFGASDMNQNTYHSEMFKFLSEILRAEWRTDIIAHIRTLPLTLQYKEALLSTITELLSITQVLGNNDKRNLGKYSYFDPMPALMLKAELRLLMTQSCADADDLEIMNAWITEQNTLEQFRAYTSRTVGGRERERNNLFIKQQQINTSEDITRSPIVEEKKRTGLRALFDR